MSEPLVRLRPYRDYRPDPEGLEAYWETRFEEARVTLEQLRLGVCEVSPPSESPQSPVALRPAPSGHPFGWWAELESREPEKPR